MRNVHWYISYDLVKYAQWNSFELKNERSEIQLAKKIAKFCFHTRRASPSLFQKFKLTHNNYLLTDSSRNSHRPPRCGDTPGRRIRRRSARLWNRRLKLTLSILNYPFYFIIKVVIVIKAIQFMYSNHLMKCFAVLPVDRAEDWKTNNVLPWLEKERNRWEMNYNWVSRTCHSW